MDPWNDTTILGMTLTTPDMTMATPGMTMNMRRGMGTPMGMVTLME